MKRSEGLQGGGCADEQSASPLQPSLQPAAFAFATPATALRQPGDVTDGGAEPLLAARGQDDDDDMIIMAAGPSLLYSGDRHAHAADDDEESGGSDNDGWGGADCCGADDADMMEGGGHSQSLAASAVFDGHLHPHLPKWGLGFERLVMVSAFGTP